MSISQVEQVKTIRNKITRFMMMYKFALSELETKVDILKEEFHLLHDYNPIEHTKSRIKTPVSIMNKLRRKGCGTSFTSIRENIKDIAGLRITCSFISDIYWISEMLSNQSDLNIVEIKDYIMNPKPNGYRSLHLLMQVPVFMSDRQEHVFVEVQIRTIAMDFWASLEHKIFYKYDQSVPARLLQELKEAADSSNQLDLRMERLHREIEAIKGEQHHDDAEELARFMIDNKHFSIPAALMELLSSEDMELGKSGV